MAQIPPEINNEYQNGLEKMRFLKYWNYSLLVFVAAAILGDLLHWSPIGLFFIAAIGVVPFVIDRPILYQAQSAGVYRA